MLFKHSLAPLVSFAGWALATSNALTSRDECIAQDVIQVYIQTYVFVYPVIINQYCPSTTVLTLNDGVTHDVTEAPTYLSTTIFITEISSFTSTL